MANTSGPEHEKSIQQVQHQWICAGIPRCGTTMMFRALAGLPPGATTPIRYEGPVLKTHSFRPARFASAKKAIFMFGDPVAAVVSTRLNRYTKAHFRNCGAGRRNPDTTDIYEEDALNYTRMFRAWTQRQSFDTICVRYETVYENLGAIRAFFEDEIYVPPPRKRLTDLASVASEAEIARIRGTYAALVREIEKAPDITIYAGVA